MPSPCLLPSCANTFPGWPLVFSQTLPKALPAWRERLTPALINTSHVRTASPTSARPGLVCLRDSLWEGQAANSPAGAHLPPPETASLGHHRTRSTLKKKLPSTGVLRSLGVLARALNFAISTRRPRGPQTCSWSYRAGSGLHRTTPVLCLRHRAGVPSQGTRLLRGVHGQPGRDQPGGHQTRPRSRLAAELDSHGRSPGPSGGPRAHPPRPLTLPAHNPRARFVSGLWGRPSSISVAFKGQQPPFIFLEIMVFFLVSIPQMKKQIQPL